MSKFGTSVRLETKLETLLKPLGEGPFDVTAFELTHDGECWSVNTPFSIGKALALTETLDVLRQRWEIFKVNYMSGARVKDLCDIGDSDGPVELEVNCTAFASIRKSE